MKYIIELEQMDDRGFCKVKSSDNNDIEIPLAFNEKGIAEYLTPYEELNCEECKYNYANSGKCKVCAVNYPCEFEPKNVKKVKRFETYSDMNKAYRDFIRLCDSIEKCEVCRIGYDIEYIEYDDENRRFAEWLMEEVEVKE